MFNCKAKSDSNNHVFEKKENFILGILLFIENRFDLKVLLSIGHFLTHVKLSSTNV